MKPLVQSEFRSSLGRLRVPKLFQFHFSIATFSITKVIHSRRRRTTNASRFQHARRRTRGSDLATAAEMMEIDGLDDGDEPSESTPAAAVFAASRRVPKYTHSNDQRRHTSVREPPASRSVALSQPSGILSRMLWSWLGIGRRVYPFMSRHWRKPGQRRMNKIPVNNFLPLHS